MKKYLDSSFIAEQKQSTERPVRIEASVSRTGPSNRGEQTEKYGPIKSFAVLSSETKVAHRKFMKIAH